VGAGTGRQALIKIIGKKDQSVSNEIKITNSYVPLMQQNFQ
jgi:hypothetical protein